MHLKLLAKITFRLLKRALLLTALSSGHLAWSYVKLPNKPIEGWGDLFVQSGVEKFYKVERGDTLYDISRTLFGDPDFWPKIWSLNSKITNPHIIEKGQVIYFVGGTPYRAPRVGMDLLKGESYSYGSHFLSPEIPPQGLTRGPIAIPKSLPNILRASTVAEESDQIAALSTSFRAAREATRKVEVSSEISNSTPTSVGKIKRVFTGAQYATVGDLVYIKVFSGTNIGDELTIFRTRPNWLPLRKLVSLKANLVEWLGRLKVISKSEGGYVAKVVHANSIIQVNEKLALKKIKMVEIPPMASKVVLKSSIDANAKIVGAHKMAASTVVGENQVVYLNSGSAAGIEEGQVYPLYTNFGETGVTELKSFVPKRIGYIKIAAVENSVATGVVFNLTSEVQVDQSVGL